MDLATLGVEIAFALCFAWSLATWIRQRDPVSREVTLAFAALGSTIVLAVARQLFGVLPDVISRVSVALLLAQPVFTLRLVALVRPLPRWALPLTYAAWAVTTVPYLALGADAPRVLLIGAAIAFVVVDVVAAIFLGLAAGARVGSARLRLALAGAATLALASVIVVASAASAVAVAADTSATLVRALAVLAAVAYLAAFLPPRPLRELWQGVTAYRGIRALLAAEGEPAARAGGGDLAAQEPIGAADVWARYARLAYETTGASAVAVIATRDGRTAVLGAEGLGTGSERTVDATMQRVGATQAGVSADLDLLAVASAGRRAAASPPASNPTVSALSEAATAAGRFVRIVPLGPAPGDPRLLLWAHRRVLFGADDERLLGALGAQAVILADRAAMKADQERLSMQLTATVEALRQASQAKSDFLASMSHELRTPLNAILGFSELMRTEPEDGNGQIPVPTEWIDHIQRGGQHLLALVNDVLDLAKIEAGRLELDPTSFEAGGAVTESVAGLRPLAERKHLSVEVDVDRDLVVVADRGRFRQVLYNLLSNAIKYTPAGGRITVTGHRVGETVRLAVADTGVGIAAADLQRVFDEFQQVGDREAQHEGTGLGLALTRRLVEAHGGRIELSSEPGQGSTFTVVLPVDEAVATPVESPRAGLAGGARSSAAVPDGVTAISAESAGRDVLIVEDDPGAARLLRAYLEPEGYTVRLAPDGEAALADARRLPPAAILLDVLLPGIDGWDVLRRIKADPVLGGIPVVIVTVVDEREVGLALGAADYLVKPVSRTALLGALDRYLGPAAASARSPRILAVDDDPLALDVIDAVLRPAGFDLVRADSGRAAIEAARTSDMDLVICDLVMPDLDGFDVVAALKDDAATRDVPILIVTAHDLTAADKARLNGQVLGVVSKGPGASAGLRDWLSTVLGGVGAVDPAAGAPA